MVRQFERQGLSRTRIEEYLSSVKSKPTSISDRRRIARRFTDHPIYFDWHIPRTREGFYHYQAGVEAATKRAIAYGPYADLLWLETADPNVNKAAGFAAKIHEEHPRKKLVYNLSPSFNWTGQGFSPEALKSFIWDLAKHGYTMALTYCTELWDTNFHSFVLQLVSLAGVHSTATITNELSKAFADDGMLAYVELVQKREKELCCDVLTHQKWSGAAYMDGIVGAIQSGSSSSKSMGEGNTESSTNQLAYHCSV